MLSGDANESGTVNSGDIFFLVNYLFLSGPAPSIPLQALPSGDDLKPDKTAVDSVTVGTVTASGSTVDVPVYIRDLAGTLLGRDQDAGSKIQSFAIKVAYSPASVVSAVTFTRSGITESLAPSAEFHPSSTSSISLVDTFQESTTPLPFTGSVAPGNLVAHLVFTLNGSATPGSTITLSLDPSVTLLANDGGSAKESPAGGTLALVDGAINIPVSTQTLPPSSVTTEGGLTNPSASIAVPAATVAGLRKSARPAIFLQDTTRPTKAIDRSPFAASYLTTTNHDASFVYDAAGDVTSDGSDSSFTYDALSMTTGATVPLSNGGTRTFAYLYTADDERIAFVEPLPSGATKTTWTLRGLDNRLLRTWADTTSSNGTHSWSWSEDEIWRGGSLLAYVSANGVRHTGLDHLGSPVVITDSLGHLIGNISYDPFGNGGATGAGMIGYTGQERDSSNVGTPWTGALPDYMHARYYSPTVGRLLSVDPVISKRALQLPQLWNRYTYVGNNPLAHVDPTGKILQIAGCENNTTNATCQGNYNLYLSTFGKQSQEAASRLNLGENGIVSFKGVSGSQFGAMFGTMGRASNFLISNRAATFSISTDSSRVDHEGGNNATTRYGAVGAEIAIDVAGYPQKMGGITQSATGALAHELGHALGTLIPGIRDAYDAELGKTPGTQHEGFSVAFENQWRREQGMDERRFYSYFYGDVRATSENIFTWPTPP
jgi:RHS repeat-associated protein